MQPRIIGYGVCQGRESERYLEGTLDCFKALCDETIILGNNLTPSERLKIAEYGFYLVEDDREWGKAQNLIKQDFIKNHVSKLNPDITVCLDMDEVLVNVTKEKIIEEIGKSEALYVYIVNLWEKGWRKDWSFSNVRIWSWALKDELGDSFWEFENRPLHCGLAPKWAYAINYQSPFVLEHYGLKEKADRMKKVERYEKYDPTQTYRAPQYYQALATDHYEPYNREEVIKWVEDETSKIHQPLSKKPPMTKKKEKVLILREADGLVFDVDKGKAHFYSKQKYQGKGFKIIDSDAPVVKHEIVKPTDKVMVYVGRHNQTGVDDTEGHITRAFEEEGWKVLKASEDDESFPEANLMFYHKWIPPSDWQGTKVGWYFDKIYFNSRADKVEQIVNASDFFFATDADGIERLGKKAYVLHQGVGYDCRGGSQIEVPPIAFTGSLYGDRDVWYQKLKDKYGDKIEHYRSKHGRDMNDLCVSAKIMLAPAYPCTDGYWSNRVYDALGRGGFMIHPYCEGLLEEFEDGKHLVLYKDEKEMFEKIDYYLKNDEKREAIRQAGRDLVREKYTYRTRIKELCSTLSTKEN